MFGRRTIPATINESAPPVDEAAVVALVNDARTRAISTAKQIELPGFRASVKILFEPLDISTDDIARTVVSLAKWQEDRQPEIAGMIFEIYNQAISDGSCDFESAKDHLIWEAENTGNFAKPEPALLPSQIWPLVRFHSIHLFWNHDRSAIIAEVQGEAAWDGEAGIAMRFYNGNDYRRR